MVWLLIGALIWVAVALLAAVLIGRAIRLADEHARANGVPRLPIPRPRPPVGPPSPPGTTSRRAAPRKPGST